MRVLGSGLMPAPPTYEPRFRRRSMSSQSRKGMAADDPPTVLIGYGLCGNGVVGLSSGRCRLVIPRVDDCIGICLGSKSAPAPKPDSIPGPTRDQGMDDMDTTQFDQVVQRYGSERADGLYRVMFAEYERLALINTGSCATSTTCATTPSTRPGSLGCVSRRFEEARTFFASCSHGPWSSGEFVICEPGSRTELTDLPGRARSGPTRVIGTAKLETDTAEEDVVIP